jgi:hypothetical protein
MVVCENALNPAQELKPLPCRLAGGGTSRNVRTGTELKFGGAEACIPALTILDDVG